MRSGQRRGRLSKSCRLEIVVEDRSVPFDTTLLPVDENMRKPECAVLIRDDFDHFLSRHGWSPGGRWPAIGPAGSHNPLSDSPKVHGLEIIKPGVS